MEWIFSIEQGFFEAVSIVYRYAIYVIVASVAVFVLTVLVIYVAQLKPKEITGGILTVTSVTALVGQAMVLCIKIAYNKLIVLDVMILVVLIIAKAWADDYWDKATYGYFDE